MLAIRVSFSVDLLVMNVQALLLKQWDTYRVWRSECLARILFYHKSNC